MRPSATSNAGGWPAAIVVMANLAIFLAGASYLVARDTSLSHHWLIPFHEALLLGQLLVLGGRAPGRTLAGLSFLVLGVATARVETIFLSHHTVHLSLTWILGAALHLRLGGACAGTFGTLNRSFGALAFVWAALTALVAFSGAVWWGIGAGT